MNIRGRQVNPWKWVVLAWVGHKIAKTGRAVVTAKRLARRKINKLIRSKYEDL